MRLIGVVKENDYIDQRYITDNFSPSEMERVYSKSSKESRKLTYLGILLLKHLMKNKLNAEVTIHYPKLDKPVLLNENKEISPYDFSISHSNELVCCVASKDKVGLDVEKIRTVNFDIMPLVFTEDEINYVQDKTSNKNQAFFEIWTRKESFVKIIGKGLTFPLKDVNLIQNNKLVDDLNINGDKYYFKRFSYEDYIVTVCH